MPSFGIITRIEGNNVEFKVAYFSVAEVHPIIIDGVTGEDRPQIRIAQFSSEVPILKQLIRKLV